MVDIGLFPVFTVMNRAGILNNAGVIKYCMLTDPLKYRYVYVSLGCATMSGITDWGYLGSASKHFLEVCTSQCSHQQDFVNVSL